MLSGAVCQIATVFCVVLTSTTAPSQQRRAPSSDQIGEMHCRKISNTLMFRNKPRCCFPVHPEQRTFVSAVGTSVQCREPTLRPSIDHLVGAVAGTLRRARAGKKGSGRRPADCSLEVTVRDRDSLDIPKHLFWVPTQCILRKATRPGRERARSSAAVGLTHSSAPAALWRSVLALDEGKAVKAFIISRLIQTNRSSLQ
jgi:hypothetical protein